MCLSMTALGFTYEVVGFTHDAMGFTDEVITTKE